MNMSMGKNDEWYFVQIDTAEGFQWVQCMDEEDVVSTIKRVVDCRHGERRSVVGIYRVKVIDAFDYSTEISLCPADDLCAPGA